MLDRDELVVERAHLLLAAVEDLGERSRGARLLSGDSADGRLSRELRFTPLSDRVDRVSRPLHERARELLVEQRDAQVLRVDLRIAAPARELHRGADSFLR